MLNLIDPPPDPPEDGKQRLRLVPRWPDVRFRRPEDPEIPWRVRLAGILIAVIISAIAVAGIVTLATMLKDVYDRMDANDRARAERAAEAAARKAEEERRAEELRSAPAGKIPVSISDKPPDPNVPRPAPKPVSAGD